MGTTNLFLQQFVDEVMDLVELTPLENALVGLPGVTGLSTEQRKRLTIAVELVANPSIIFMDEPTSGLDARAAAIVMRTVRNTVNTGRTVVCTIHQPSIDIFEAFDEVSLSLACSLPPHICVLRSHVNNYF
jgi:ABC-type multidrug transport system ATPase subunit